MWAIVFEKVTSILPGRTTQVNASPPTIAYRTKNQGNEGICMMTLSLVPSYATFSHIANEKMAVDDRPRKPLLVLPVL